MTQASTKRAVENQGFDKQAVVNKIIPRPRVYARAPEMRPQPQQQHKFAVGDKVALALSPGDFRPKNMDVELLSARFEITRLLPVQGRIFQYRVKDAASGQERVVAEEYILPGEEAAE